MADTSKKSVDETIDQVAAETDNAAMVEVKEAIGKAQTALKAARESMQESVGKSGAAAAEASRAYLEEARRHLGEARNAISGLAARAREQAEVLYAKAKEQYDALAVHSRELYGKVRDKVSEVDLRQKGDQALEYVRANPGKAILISLAAGFLIGYITRPRD